MSAVLTVALPVFAIIAVGFAAARLSALAAEDAAALNRFVFRIAMPAALFGLAARTQPPGVADAGIAGAYAIGALAAILIGYFLSKSVFSLSAPEAGAHAFASTLGNAVFLGLPIAMNVDCWARPFIILMLIEGTVVIAIGAALIGRKNDESLITLFTGPLKNPLVIGMAAGFIYAALGLPLTGPFETFFDYLGRAAGPTALVSLGLFLATHRFPSVRLVAGRVATIGAIKMGLLPAMAIGLAVVFGVSDTHYLGALALFTMVPTGAIAFVMASQHNVYATEAAAAVLTTTLFSVLTISGVLIYFS